MHFGWPDHVDVFSTTFADRMARYARAFAQCLAGGDVRCMNPFAIARGDELKAQFVRASIHAMEAIWDVLPSARFMQPEPLINIVASPEQPKTRRRVECDNEYQYQAWDMLCGHEESVSRSDSPARPKPEYPPAWH